jgi:hypothetical protein
MIGQLARIVLGAPETVGMSRRQKLVVFGSSAAFTAVIAVALFLILGRSEQTARDAATRFASALVRDDPSAAPPGARDYVAGVRAYFGPVRSARVIGAHNKHVNTGDNADTRSFFVTELLLHTQRGPAAIELEFDNHALFSDEVSGVRELEPDDAPGLSARTRERLAAAYVARGGRPADQIVLSATRAAPEPATEAPEPAPQEHAIENRRAPARRTARQRAAARQLHCVESARGDVAKLQQCAHL